MIHPYKRNALLELNDRIKRRRYIPKRKRTSRKSALLKGSEEAEPAAEVAHTSDTSHVHYEWEQADASAEIGLPRSSWNIRRQATE